MVFIKPTAEENIHESIPNMGLKEMTWLWLSWLRLRLRKPRLKQSKFTKILTGCKAHIIRTILK